MENRSLAARVGINIGAFLIAWALFGIGIRAGNRLHEPLQDALGLAGAALGLWIALRLRARLGSIIIAGFVLMIAVEFLFHLIYGYHMVQSGPTHLAILTASLGGVLLGTFSLSRVLPLRPNAS